MFDYQLYVKPPFFSGDLNPNTIKDNATVSCVLYAIGK